VTVPAQKILFEFILIYLPKGLQALLFEIDNTPPICIAAFKKSAFFGKMGRTEMRRRGFVALAPRVSLVISV